VLIDARLFSEMHRLWMEPVFARVVVSHGVALFSYISVDRRVNSVPWKIRKEMKAKFVWPPFKMGKVTREIAGT
jgi:hypothetical protein